MDLRGRGETGSTKDGFHPGVLGAHFEGRPQAHIEIDKSGEVAPALHGIAARAAKSRKDAPLQSGTVRNRGAGMFLLDPVRHAFHESTLQLRPEKTHLLRSD